MITDYEAEAPKAGNALWITGFLMTGVWLVLVALYVAWKWSTFGTMEPNAIGDFAAGVFAPLAFLWLVLGFFQQGEELRNSGKALWLQGKELQASVEQQRELVNVTREQLTFESDMLKEQREEVERKSRPILTLDPGGSMPDGPEKRLYDFRITNTGNPCTALAVLVLGNEVKRQPVLGTGANLSFHLSLAAGGDLLPMPVLVSYLDARTLPGWAKFAIARLGEKFNITEGWDKVDPKLRVLAGDVA